MIQIIPFNDSFASMMLQRPRKTRLPAHVSIRFVGHKNRIVDFFALNCTIPHYIQAARSLFCYCLQN